MVRKILHYVVIFYVFCVFNLPVFAQSSLTSPSQQCLSCRAAAESNGKSTEEAKAACHTTCEVPSGPPVFEGDITRDQGKLMFRDPNGGLKIGYNQFQAGIMGFSCGIANSPTAGRCCTGGAKVGDFKLELGNPGDLALTPVTFPITVAMNILGAASTGLISGIQAVTGIFGHSNNPYQLACSPGSYPWPKAGDDSCTCRLDESVPGIDSMKDLCKLQSSATEQLSCMDCILGNNAYKKTGIWTGLGCVYTDTSLFIQRTVLGYGIGIAGGTSLLCIMYSAFLLQSSRGNPEKIKKSQEILTSCIVGLLLIIFSVFMLKVIGVDILGIPGFK